MGTWDTDILDDDIAMDVQSEFSDLIDEGYSVKEATKQILQSYEEELEDEDDGSIIYLTLALLQLEQDEVEAKIKKKALDIIEEGLGLDRWEEAGEEVYQERLAVLSGLKERLLRH